MKCSPNTMNTPQIASVRHDGRSEVWYFMAKGRLDEAQKAMDEWSSKQPGQSEVPATKALLLAMKGPEWMPRCRGSRCILAASSFTAAGAPPGSASPSAAGLSGSDRSPAPRRRNPRA